MMPTKEQELKQRLVAVLSDLKENGTTGDPESFWQIGSLASTLIDAAKAPSWRQMKDGLTRADYDKLLGDLQQNGNALYQAGETRKAYAIQAIGISLVCRTQRADPQMAKGESLLDAAIAKAVRIYRRTQQRN